MFSFPPHYEPNAPYYSNHQHHFDSIADLCFFQDRERVGNTCDGRDGRHIHILPVIRRHCE